MSFYSYEMVLVGVILLGAMAACGLKIWLNKRQTYLEQIKLKEKSESQHDAA